MAAKKLKVFKTTIGFHDAYVAAPSQKAALAAWGSDHNLFATGAAEQISDAALTAEPLAKPGEVIKKVRGSVGDHLAALTKTDRPRRSTKAPLPPRCRARAAQDSIGPKRRWHRQRPLVTTPWSSLRARKRTSRGAAGISNARMSETPNSLPAYATTNAANMKKRWRDGARDERPIGATATANRQAATGGKRPGDIMGIPDIWGVTGAL
jgi:hypothetical protein